MIAGVGIDLLEIDRIKKLLAQPHGDRFVERVLTPEEREQASRRGGRLAEYVAGRFAAKEAVVKALGCGIGREVGFQDIRILPGPTGKPECVLSERACARLGKMRQLTIHLSITHSATMAGAYAVVETE
ncbi:holo-ACP synthase [Paenibacillus flagellatus]|uniref:Holo-[acyl-carrier-protein] synthase n=1 Tax=Paenibacillus flagellatus TaxID=2211139 RepID=A0A2V5JZW5_9BACL|nr:holo-ACP synthase [Paenibacillus flagellatus]PYI50743.1 holo-[acyl-carrier-protein] synthase [Paenibacillus flagellatus]